MGAKFMRSLRHHWPSIVGAVTNIPGIWHGLVWLFDWGARIDLAITKLREFGGTGAAVAFLNRTGCHFMDFHHRCEISLSQRGRLGLELLFKFAKLGFIGVFGLRYPRGLVLQHAERLSCE